MSGNDSGERDRLARERDRISRSGVGCHRRCVNDGMWRESITDAQLTIYSTEENTVRTGKFLLVSTRGCHTENTPTEPDDDLRTDGGLTTVEADVLRALREADEPVRTTETARRTGWARSTVGEAFRALVERGIVASRPDPTAAQFKLYYFPDDPPAWAAEGLATDGGHPEPEHYLVVSAGRTTRRFKHLPDPDDPSTPRCSLNARKWLRKPPAVVDRMDLNTCERCLQAAGRLPEKEGVTP